MSFDYSKCKHREFNVTVTLTVSASNSTNSFETVYLNEIFDEERETLLATLRTKKTPFFPATVRTAISTSSPRQAPKPQPPKRWMHFGNEKLWNRRNRPAP